METENQYLYIDTEPKPWDKAKNVISVTETGITFYIMYVSICICETIYPKHLYSFQIILI